MHPLCKRIKIYARRSITKGILKGVYKETNPVKTQSSVSNMYYGECALLKDVKADALLKVSFGLCFKAGIKSQHTMSPYLTIELVGISNGDFSPFMGNTK